MKLRFLISIFILEIMFIFGESKSLLDNGAIDPEDLAMITSALAKAEPRQMGILGFAALGAMMFPILVSLGMASFVSHLPTVFKEFATEFGIPSTPPRNFLLLRRKRSDSEIGYEERWQDFLKVFHSDLMKNLEKRNVYHKYTKKL